MVLLYPHTRDERSVFQQGLAASPRADGADHRQSAAHLPDRDRRARRTLRRGTGAPLRPRIPDLCGPRRAVERLRTVGARAGTGEERRRLSVHAESARVRRAVARHHPGRRRRRAAEHEPVRSGAGSLHQRRRAQAHRRGGGALRRVHHRAAGACCAGDDLVTRQRARRISPPRPRRRAICRRPAEPGRAPTRDDRRARAPHLHVGHHRAP